MRALNKAMKPDNQCHCASQRQSPHPLHSVKRFCLGLLMAGAAWQAAPGLAASNSPIPKPVMPVVAAMPEVAAAPVVTTTLVKVADGRSLAPDIARIVNKGELVIAMLGADTPPFFATKGDTVEGLEVNIARAIAKELKVAVRFERSAKSFNEVVEVVARGDADLGISKLSRTLARAQSISFSDPYLRLAHSFILNRVRFAEYARDMPLPTALRQYKGSLGVIAKSSFADYAQRNFPKADLREYPNWAEVLKAVKSGQIIAAYRDEFEVKRVLRSDATLSLTLRTVTFKDLDDTLGIAVGIQDPVLLAFVNQYLAQTPEKLTIDVVLKALDR